MDPLVTQPRRMCFNWVMLEALVGTLLSPATHTSVGEHLHPVHPDELVEALRSLEVAGKENHPKTEGHGPVSCLMQLLSTCSSLHHL